MKIKNVFSIILFSLSSFSAYSQVAITEVYYDTPYYEKYYGQSTNGAHHLGEYIELYNYTTEDITLNGWAITDIASKYTFPSDLVIPSESFIVIAYRDLYIAPDTDDYFATFFPSTEGMESQIRYQGDMMLRNNMEYLTLRMGMVRGTNLKGYPVQTMHWTQSNPMSNEDPGNADPSNVNFYLPSLHLTPSGTFASSIATPLSAGYVPPTQDLEAVSSYVNAVNLVYSNLTWEEYSRAILQATCNLVIPSIEQSSPQDHSTLKKCFTYDISGNYESTQTCVEQQNRQAETDSVAVDSTDEGYSAEELEDIGSHIVLYPNPTSTIVNISWDASISGKISDIQVFSTSGVYVFSATISSSQLSVAVDLSSQPSGIYLVDFILDSSQQITRNIIKL